MVQKLTLQRPATSDPNGLRPASPSQGLNQNEDCPQHIAGNRALTPTRSSSHRSSFLVDISLFIMDSGDPAASSPPHRLNDASNTLKVLHVAHVVNSVKDLVLWKRIARLWDIRVTGYHWHKICEILHRTYKPVPRHDAKLLKEPKWVQSFQETKNTIPNYKLYSRKGFSAAQDAVVVALRKAGMDFRDIENVVHRNGTSVRSG
jgi:hypothetical protein